MTRSRDDRGGDVTLTLTDADTILRPLIRSIDKRAEYSIALREGERSEVAVTLSMRRQTTTVTIPVDALTAARQDSMRRNQLRTTLKRALDKMMFVSSPIASTKMLRAATQAEGYFRVPSGRRGR
jgi:hypothetical protein